MTPRDPFPIIRGVPFWPLGHRDGRFVRAPGLYALARRQPDGRYLVLHLGLAQAINREAAAGHSRWSWALAEGMDSLLVHLFGARTALPEAVTAHSDTVDWHPNAEVTLFAADLEDGQAPASPDTANVTGRSGR